MGSVSSLHLKFDMSGIPGVGGIDGANDLADVRLLVDEDGVFANDATSVSPTTYNNTTDIVEFDHNFASATGYYFTIGSVDGTNSPLPVKLLTFQAKKDGEHVNLNWVTSTELNNSHFDIERSMDTGSWTFVGQVPGSGTISVPKEYKSKDYNPDKGINYYRLKQVDYDCKFYYSDIVTVNFDHNLFKAVVYPNPVRNTINLFTELSLDNPEILLLNPYGQAIPTQVSLVNDREVKIDVSNINSGVYYLRINNLGQTHIEKIVIAK